MDIYIIKNSINEKVYIGKTKYNTLTRQYQHLKHLNNGQYIHNAMKKLGVENFQVETIETNIEDIETLNEREKYWIAFYDCKPPKGYNIQDGGDNSRIQDKEVQKEQAIENPEQAEKIKKHFDDIRHLGVPAMLQDRKINPEKYKIHDENAAKNLQKQREQNPDKVIESGKRVAQDFEKQKKEHPDLEKQRIEKVIKANKKKSKKIICITTGEIFESMNEAERQTGISHGHISQVCNGKRNYAGITKNGEKRVQQLYEE